MGLLVLLAVCACLLVGIQGYPWPPATLPSWDQLAAYSSTTVAMKDPILRNFYITEGYYLISLKMKELLRVGQNETSDGSTEGNWCSISLWASASVGENMRRQTLYDWVREVLMGWPENIIQLVEELGPDWFDQLPWVQQLLSEMAAPLGEGNLIVFDEVGGAFTLYGQYFSTTPKPSEANVTLLMDFLNTFDNATQPLLREAMLHYWQAQYSATSTQNQAELIGWANWLTGLHEQTRLQPYINSSFPLPFNVTLFNHTYTINFKPLATDYLIALALPDQLMWIGKDLPLRLDGLMWPKLLQNLTLAGTQQLYTNLVINAGVPSFNSLQNTASDDWSNLTQRMRFVTPLFRSRQDDISLDCNPFSPDNWALILNGTIPVEDDLCYSDCCEIDPSIKLRQWRRTNALSVGM